ncbi:MAG: PIG-L deacetylase family protein [Bellilinea sp.]
MSSKNLYIPESAMAIVAHPDDIEFSCAGTLARWARLGTRISYVLCTSGDVGIADPAVTRQQAAQIREAEQAAAAQVIGASEVIFLREPDGLLQPTLELRKKLVREIRRFRPEVVICGDPTVVFANGTYINHPDHRAAATAALDAVFPAAGQPHLFEELVAEGLKAHKVRKVYITAWGNGDTFVSIDETIDLKIEALKQHKSQMKDWDPSEMVNNWAAETAKGKEMAFAESFRLITLMSDEDWQKYLTSNESTAQTSPAAAD